MTAADVAGEKVSRRSRGRTPGPPPASVTEPVTAVEVERLEVTAVAEEKVVQELIDEVIELSVADPITEENVEII